MKAYLTDRSVVYEADGACFATNLDWNDLFATSDPARLLREATVEPVELGDVQAPIDRQEVWAAGVTYYRSRTARMSESEVAGGGSFYDRVYKAARPELFFKGTKSRVVAPGAPVRVRGDSIWSVPEPELALAVNSHGRIVGYTIGNDMSARDIEGENPLYLPQAKIYRGSCALGPGVLIASDPLPPETQIRLDIRRQGTTVFAGSIALSAMQRKPEDLVDFLFREDDFPSGCYLLTGTGIVPPDQFALQSGDEIAITIEPIGTLVNTVE